MPRLNSTSTLKGLCLTFGTILGLTLLPSNALAQTVITEWNFNNSTTTPNIGIGTATLVGGTTPTFQSGSVNGGSSDPAGNTNNNAWHTTSYPAQGTGATTNKTAGVQFAVSTAGYQNIIVEWDQRFSNTSSRNVQFQYSTDGTSFTDFGPFVTATAGDTWINNNTRDLSGIAGVNDNPNFAFRIVSASDPTNIANYLAASPTGNYAGTGTWRFDMVQVNATPVPEPFTILGSLTAIGFGTAIKRKYANARLVK